MNIKTATKNLDLLNTLVNEPVSVSNHCSTMWIVGTLTATIPQNSVFQVKATEYTLATFGPFDVKKIDHNHITLF